MKYVKLRYDTTREICFAPEDIMRLSDALQAQDMPCHISHLMSQEPDPVRLAQVKDVIETAISGRKYEVLLLRSEGKTYSEIALLLAISKSAVQNHYKRAVHQVQVALGVHQQNGAVRPVSA